MPGHAEPKLQRFLVSKALQSHAGVNEVQRCATEVRDEPQLAATGACSSPARQMGAIKDSLMGIVGPQFQTAG